MVAALMPCRPAETLLFVRRLGKKKFIANFGGFLPNLACGPKSLRNRAGRQTPPAPALNVKALLKCTAILRYRQ
ncbi:hypothetical protein [Atlantibacter sp.]|uniref:hypothetical protein n=1 Tax=Atlantibacter sp. TaxID=1903473 RepID=UPI0028A8571D|nr:hypothetical protein [Atlantibacter sp.]